MKLALRLIGGSGVLLFALGLMLTFVSPIRYELAARDFIESEIERQIRGGLGIVPGESNHVRRSRLAQALAAQHRDEIDALNERLRSGLEARIAQAVSRMQDLSCECRQLIARGLLAPMESRVADLEAAAPQLQRIVEGRYADIVTGLVRDIRIFTATNLMAFLLLLILSFTERDRLRQLFLPGMLLAVSATASTGIYLFGQNWFFTIMHADYTGMAYAGWLALIFGLLCDVVMLKGRITSRILDALPVPGC